MQEAQKQESSIHNDGPLSAALFQHLRQYYNILKEDVNEVVGAEPGDNEASS